MSSIPNATRGSSPQRLRKPESQRNDDQSSASPIGRKASISSTAVKSREAYSARRTQLLARTLGDYGDEEPQQQQEQGQKPQTEHPPVTEPSVKDTRHKQTKKSEHAGNHFHYFFDVHQCTF
jgi:hypothetical protein